MKVKIINEDEIRESIPIEVHITGTSNPKLVVDNLGTVKVTPSKAKEHKATFWAMESGKYTLRVQDGENVWEQIIEVKEQNYISFKQEFGLFAILLTITAIGLIRWTSKFKKKNV